MKNFFTMSLMILFLHASVCMQAMEMISNALPTVVMIGVPVVSGLTLYNSCKADFERDRWKQYFRGQGAEKKANRFTTGLPENKDGDVTLSCSTLFAASSFGCLGGAFIQFDDSAFKNACLALAAGTSVASYALQKYNRYQLDRAKKWVSSDFSQTQEPVGSVENV